MVELTLFVTTTNLNLVEVTKEHTTTHQPTNQQEYLYNNIVHNKEKKKTKTFTKRKIRKLFTKSKTNKTKKKKKTEYKRSNAQNCIFR